MADQKLNLEGALASLPPESLNQLADLIIAKLNGNGMGVLASQASCLPSKLGKLELDTKLF